MIVYRDIVSNDELISDSFRMKEIDDIVYEVDCAMITEAGVKVDIGANASAEGEDADDGVDDSAQTYNNVVHTFRLQPMSFTKKSYQAYLKDYMKTLKKHLQETNPERVDKFMAGASTMAVKILGNFDDYEFYVGEEMDPEGMVVLLGYREDGTTPYCIYWKDGMKGEKF